MARGQATQTTTANDTDRLLTVQELAAMLQICKNTLDRDRMSGAGNYPPFVRIGQKSIRYRLSTVHSWLDKQPEHTQTPQPQQVA